MPVEVSGQDFVRGTGYIPDFNRPDYKPYATRLGAGVPEDWNLLERFPERWQREVEDQEMTNSCVGNAVISAWEFTWMKQTGNWADFSRMLAYWWARVVKGWQNQDGGCMIYDAMHMAADRGICLESYHPFRTLEGRSTVFTPPSERAVAQAERHQALGARRLDRTQVFDALASGRPVVFGFTVYNHAVFGPQALNEGFIPMPRTWNDFGGGHAMCLAGYSKSRGRVFGPNSWGTDWGSNNIHKPGWFEMDIGYIFDPKLSADFWVLDMIEEVRFG